MSMTLKIDPTTQSTNVGSTELNNFDDLVQWIHKIFRVRILSFIDAEYAGHHYDHCLQEFQKIHHGGDSIWDAVSCLFPRNLYNVSSKVIRPPFGIRVGDLRNGAKKLM